MTTGSWRSRIGLLEPLAADALGQDAQRRQRRAAGHQHGAAVRAFLGAERQPVEVVVLEVVGVDRAGPVLRLHRVEGAAGLVAPRPSGAAARGPRGRGSRPRSAAPRSSGPRSAMSPATNGASATRRPAGAPPGGAANRSPGIVPAQPPSDSGHGSPARGRLRHVTSASRRSRPADSRAGRRSRDRPRDSRRCGTRHRPASPAPSATATRRRPARRTVPRPSCSRGDGRGRPWLRWTPSSSRQRSSGADLVAAEHGVDGVGDVGVDGDPLAVDDLDDDVEGRRRLALEDALLGPPPARLLVAEGDALDPADQVGQGRVEHQVVEVVAVRRADQLDAALGDGPRGRPPRAPSRSRR